MNENTQKFLLLLATVINAQRFCDSLDEHIFALRYLADDLEKAKKELEKTS